MEAGTRLEHYEIVAPVGEGGMGAVYRAEDTRLKRTVAIKVLPPEFAADPERLARLEREAQLLATMSHPNVATVHGFGHDTVQQEGSSVAVAFLVMELVPGPSLHDRIDEGPLPWREAVDIAIGIAAGLEAAHERGIVHRDLKPANVHVGEAHPADRSAVKVLDFGLAKAFEGDAVSGTLELSASPTVAAATRTGMILGTASYMSPEQARGRAVDKRTDIWALGCVIYEMLTGKKAFAGDTVSDILAAILKEEPDLGALPPIPLRLRHLLERCLDKQPGQRMRDVGDVRLELEAAREERASSGSAASTRTSPRLVAGVALLAVAAGLAGGYLLRGSPEPGAEMHLMVSPEAIADGPDALDISPDGRWIAEIGPNSNLRVRAIDDPNWRTIDGTDFAVSLTFSADSRRIFFTTGGANTASAILASVGLDGTTPATEAELAGGFATVFRGLSGEVMAVAVAGPAGYRVYRREASGAVVEVAQLPARRGFMMLTAQVSEDRWLGWTFQNTDVGGLILAGPTEEETVEFMAGYRTPAYLGEGRVLAVDAQGRLVSATIDTTTGAFVSPPAIELEGLSLASGFAGSYATSDTGMLVYVSGPLGAAEAGQLLSWMDLSGRPEALSTRSGDYLVDSRVSPDGSRLALEMNMPDVSVWIHDLDRDVQTALTPGLLANFPVWSPDSRQLIFHSLDADPMGLYRAPIDRSTAPELLLPNPEGRYTLPMDWSPDGSLLLYVESDTVNRSLAGSHNDLWLLPLEGGEPRPFLATSAAEIDGRFSPDGRWVAYASHQTGQSEVYLRAVDGGGEYRISADGGESPEWNPTGGGLWFLREEELMVVDIDTSGATPAVSAERRQLLFPRNLRPELWHPHPDGERFLVAQWGDFGADSQRADGRSIRAILNWPVLTR